MAIGHLRRAAAQASAQLSFADAIAHLKTARTLSDDSDRLLRAQLAIDQGDAEKNAGLSLVALGAFDSAFDDARAAGDCALVAAAALRYEDASWRPGRFGGPAVERLRVAESVVDHDDEETRARIQIGLTRALAMCGDAQGSMTAWEEARRLITQIGDTEIEIEGLAAYLGTTFLQVSGTEELLELVDRMADIAPRTDNVDNRILAGQVQLIYLARFGRMDDYRRVSQRVGADMAELHSRFWTFTVANHHAMLALYDGDLAEAEDAAETCLQLAEHLVDEDNSGLYGLRMFLIRREQQRLAPLVPLMRHLAATGDSAGFWSPGLALLLAETGDTESAAALFAEFADVGFDIPRDAMWSTVMTMFIELAVALAEVQACRTLYEAFSSQSGLMVITGSSVICLGSSDRYLGMLALTFGDLQRAEGHLCRAVTVDEGNGSALWTAHARLWLARVRRDQGRVEEATELAEGVAAVAHDRGYAALRAGTQTLL